MKDMRIAFIGAGNHARTVLYPSLTHVEGVDLIGMCDLDQAGIDFIKKRYKVDRTYTDYREMLSKEDIDAVFCCGGPALHYEAAKHIIKKGIPLFSEKPPAPTAEKTKEMAELADSCGACVMVAFMHRYADITLWAKKIINTPEFGQIRMLSAKEGIWGTKIENVTLDSGIHHLDLIGAFGGAAEWVYADRSTDGGKRHGYAIIIHFVNGITCSMNLNSLEALSTPSDVIEIYGDQGQWIKLENWAKASLIKETGIYGAPPDDPMKTSLVYQHSWTGASVNRSLKIQGYIGEVEHFIDCVRNNKKPVPGLWDAYRAMQLVEAINQSCATGEKVYIK
jgi:myo-inositol 2-dehydrogenase/D-chiro-inositol 1-dehydrogenase